MSFLINEPEATTLLQPIVDEAVERAMSDLAGRVVPALEGALGRVLDGLQVTITISRKVQSETLDKLGDSIPGDGGAGGQLPASSGS